MQLDSLSQPTLIDLLVSFADLEDWRGLARDLGDPIESFRLMDSLDKAIGPIVEEAGGIVVKTIGDAWLLAFPIEAADAGIRALLAVKEAVERNLKERGHKNRLRVTAHAGSVVAGAFGAAGRLDIYGETINAAASIGRGEHRGRFAISPEAFRSLKPDTRKLFRRHTPAIVYLAT